MKKNEGKIALLFLFLSFLGAAFFIYTASVRTLSTLENVLLQIFILGAGIIGSFIFGRQSARDAAREIIKPHARSAFRRLLSLYQSLSRLGNEIEISQKEYREDDDRIILAKLKVLVIEQLATADDALEDWKDIIPDDVNELQTKLQQKNKPGGHK